MFSARTIGAGWFPGFPVSSEYDTAREVQAAAIAAGPGRYSIDQQRERARMGRSRRARSSWVQREWRESKEFGVMAERGVMGIGGDKFVSSLFVFSRNTRHLKWMYRSRATNLCAGLSEKEGRV
jgi:hypothetical protein